MRIGLAIGPKTHGSSVADVTITAAAVWAAPGLKLRSRIDRGEFEKDQYLRHGDG